MLQMLMDELGTFLDARQAELLETLDRLNTLRAAVVRRDETALAQLLEQVRLDAGQKRNIDAAQQAIEQRLLAAVEGLEPPVTLSRVCARIPDDLRPPLRQKQAALLDAALRVQNELAATEMLLRECARCNREMLAAVLGRDRQSLTYDLQGQSQWNVHHGLVSMKF